MRNIQLLQIILVHIITESLPILIDFKLQQDGEPNNPIQHKKILHAEPSNGKESIQIVNYPMEKYKGIHFVQSVITSISLEVNSNQIINRQNSRLICKYSSQN